MSGLNKDRGTTGNIVQVFVPHQRINGADFTPSHGQVYRFTKAGQYELNNDGVKVPFLASMTMGIPYGTTNLKVYDVSGATLTAQVVEIM